MTISDRFRASSKRLITMYGKTRIYEHKDGDEDYDVETGTTTGGTTLYSIKVMKVDPREKELKSPNLVNRKTAAMLVAAIDIPFKPSVGDKIRDQYLGVDDVYEVMDVRSNDTGDEVALWRLICVQV